MPRRNEEDIPECTRSRCNYTRFRADSEWKKRGIRVPHLEEVEKGEVATNLNLEKEGDYIHLDSYHCLRRKELNVSHETTYRRITVVEVIISEVLDEVMRALVSLGT